MPATSNVQIVRCPNCGANNRVNESYTLQRAPVCGRCKTQLLVATHPITVTDANYAVQVETSPLRSCLIYGRRGVDLAG
jgi:uncharacterized paraquat-inducible protein A